MGGEVDIALRGVYDSLGALLDGCLELQIVSEEIMLCGGHVVLKESCHLVRCSGDGLVAHRRRSNGQCQHHNSTVSIAHFLVFDLCRAMLDTIQNTRHDTCGQINRLQLLLVKTGCSASCAD